MPPNPTSWHLRNANRKAGTLGLRCELAAGKTAHLPARVISMTRAGIAKKEKKAMKDKVTAVHIDLSDYTHKTDCLGTLVIFRERKEERSHITTHRSIYPKNLMRALETERLFLAQLEKKAGRGE